MTGNRLVLLAWLLLGAGDGLTVGTYNGEALTLICAGFVALSLPVLLPERLPLRPPSAIELNLAVLVAAALFIPLNLVTQPPLGFAQARALLFLGAFVGGCLLASHRTRALAGVVGIVAGAVAGALVIPAERRPPIDVWYLVTGSADSIVHGTNMFTDTWPVSPGITDTFPYLPGTGLLLAPWRVVGLDVRYGLLLAAIVAALVIWRLAPAPVGPALALLAVLVPGWLLLVDLSWTEPLLLAALSGMFLAVDRGRLGCAIIALAVALATKQHVLLLLPVLAVWPAFGLRRVAIATAAAGTVCLPWLVATPSAFLHDALFYNLELTPRRDSLSLYSLALHHGWQPSFFLVGALSLLALAIACRRVQTPAAVALSCTWALATFTLLNKQSFYNEWWLVVTMTLLALALARPVDRDQQEGAREVSSAGVA